MTGDADLERLLAARLPSVADDGFSGRVVAEIAARERKSMLVEAGAGFGVFVVLLASVPISGISQLLESATLNLSTSVPLAVACAALAVTYAAMRVFAD